MLARTRIIAPLFLLSGGTALLYQVAFGKQLATIYGATAYAVSAVLAAFMGGLALGSYVGGRVAHRVARPLVVYGVAEAAVGAVCAITPSMFEAISSAYGRFAGSIPGSLVLLTALRSLLTGGVVLVPTVAMGVTLPMLARALAAHGEDGEGSRRRLATLYAMNTFGGALGAVLSAYVVLPSLGIAGTMRAAALVNVVIGVVAVAVGWRGDASRADDTSTPDEPSVTPIPEGRLLAALAFASGLFVFAVEVVDTHLLALLIGNSAYAFGLMLAVFLTCLSLGATLAGAVDRRLGNAALPVALIAASLGLSCSLPIFGQLPRLFLYVGGSVASWSGRELVRALAAALALAIPTTAMGLTFPLLLRRVAGRADVGREVGRLTAINTLGSIAGSLVCGYFVLPRLGSELTLRLVAALFALSGVALALRADAKKTLAFGCGGAALAAAALVPRWDMLLLTNGANVYFDAPRPPDELVYVAEDVHGGLTSVARRGDVLTLYTNGKFQGDNGHEVTAQRCFAHFPAMFVRDFGRALVIGLGTGTTLGTILTYPFREIEAVEISPAIVHAATTYFAEPNRQALGDPRVVTRLNDGRNLLLVERKSFDLITIELSSVWFAGAATLYSEDFYRLVRERLAEGGVLQQWVQLHHIRPRELAVALRTMRRVFPHVALFVSGGQGIVVLSGAPLVASRARLAELSERPGVAETLGGVHGLETLLERAVLSGQALDRFIAEHAADAPEASTDDNLFLEYATPKGNVMSYDASIDAMQKLLMSYRAGEAVAALLRD